MSKRVFRTVLSEPFEKEVAARLRSFGFRAGTVNDKGIWLIPNGPINLREKVGSAPPGEIDVLAVHDELGLLTIECKILAAPMNRAALRNMMGKLGEDDLEAIRKKVLRKLAWCQLALPLHSSGSSGAAAVIVLDRPWPGIAVGPDVSVVPFDILETAVASLSRD